MKYEMLLDKYTKEYKKYIDMGLSEEDAVSLVEKHIKKEVTVDTVFGLFDSFSFDRWFKDDFYSLDSDFSEVIKEIKEVLKSSKKEEPKKVSEETPSKKEVKKEEIPVKKEEVKKEVIADTPTHKEFRVTYPNGYYEYKMLIK